MCNHRGFVGTGVLDGPICFRLKCIISGLSGRPVPTKYEPTESYRTGLLNGKLRLTKNLLAAELARLSPHAEYVEVPYDEKPPRGRL